jgi:hypothetical protein
MSVLKSELLVIFGILTTSVFLWRFVRDKNMAELSGKNLMPALKVLLAMVIPIGGLMWLGSMAGMELAVAAPYFAAAAAVPYLLSSIGLPPFLRALLLLAVSVAFTSFVPADHDRVCLGAVVAGLICWKSAENLLVKPEKSTLEDFVPPFLWLVTIYWTKTAEADTWVALHQNVILASFVAAIFMRWIQDPFLKIDKLYVKRVCLAVTGGLVLLILVTKVVAALELAKLCAIAGGGYLLTYVLQALDHPRENESIALNSFKQLLFIGIFTLLATRLFFTPGLIVLAISTVIATTSGAALIAGVYFGSYIFLQAFIYQFNSNMTGINIMHSYTSAALYAGLFIAITASLLLRERMDNRARALLFISAGILAPGATSYFLHAEPTASLLVATLVGTVIIGIFCRALANAEWKGYENVMLAPALMIAVGLLTGELIATGNAADAQQRYTALIGLGVAATAVLAIASFMSRQNSNEGPELKEPTIAVDDPALIPKDPKVIELSDMEVKELEKEEAKAEAKVEE